MLTPMAGSLLGVQKSVHITSNLPKGVRMRVKLATKIFFCVLTAMLIV